MSTRNINGRTGRLLTDPSLYQYTQPLTRYVLQLLRRAQRAGNASYRDAAGVRIVESIDGRTPARFVVSEMEVDILARFFNGVDPLVLGTPAAASKYPKVMGPTIHEVLHLAYSTTDLRRLSRLKTPPFVEMFLRLEEGRIETQGMPILLPAELEALRYMVMTLVLEGLEDRADKLTGKHLALDLLSLTAARAEAGILDREVPSVAKMFEAIEEQLGEDDYTFFYEKGVEFSQISLGAYSDNESKLFKITEEWLDRAADLPPEGEGGTKCRLGTKSGPKPEEGEEESETKTGGKGDEGDEGDESGEGTGKPDTSDESGGGEGESEGESKSEGESESKSKSEGDDSDRLPGDDDEGRMGDGSIEAATNGGGAGHLGDYGSTHLPDDWSELFSDVEKLAEALGDRGVGAEIEKITGHRLGEELKASNRADAAAHAKRRREKEIGRLEWQGRRKRHG